nr:MAG TPA: hypothetical protein [Crassvirales sp.]
MLNVFISSVCQNQTRPCRQFYNMPRLLFRLNTP